MSASCTISNLLLSVRASRDTQDALKSDTHRNTCRPVTQQLSPLIHYHKYVTKWTQIAFLWTTFLKPPPPPMMMISNHPGNWGRGSHKIKFILAIHGVNTIMCVYVYMDQLKEGHIIIILMIVLLTWLCVYVRDLWPMFHQHEERERKIGRKPLFHSPATIIERRVQRFMTPAHTRSRARGLAINDDV